MFFLGCTSDQCRSDAVRCHRRRRRWEVWICRLCLTGVGWIAFAGPGVAQDVVLPVEDFDRLWARAHEAADEPEPAIDAAFESAEVEVRVNGAGVTTRYRLRVATFGHGAVQIGLPPAGGWTDADWSQLAEGSSGTLLSGSGLSGSGLSGPS